MKDLKTHPDAGHEPYANTDGRDMSKKESKSASSSSASSSIFELWFGPLNKNRPLQTLLWMELHSRNNALRVPINSF